MLIVMRQDAAKADVDHVIASIESVGLKAHVSEGKFRTIVGAVGDRERIVDMPFEAMPGVEKAVAISKPFKFVASEFKPGGSIVDIGGVPVGRGHLTVIAGPCSVESDTQALDAALAVKAAGAQLLRGGAFKPRTSPYSFQGLGHSGLALLAECRRITGLPVVTEVLDARDIGPVSEVADCLQIGARNMQNFLLLREVGQQDKPVLIKRGFSNTVEELLMSAEYVAKGGNDNIVFCERGIRTFEPTTKATLDVAAISILRKQSHLPVIVDPSHAAGRADLVLPLALAGVAAGADGVMVEVHPDPISALSDGEQALRLDDLQNFIDQVRRVAVAVGSI